VLAQFVDAEFGADVDVSPEVEMIVVGDGFEHADDLADLGVVGGDAEADEPERFGEALEHVDFDAARGHEEVFGGIEAAGA